MEQESISMEVVNPQAAGIDIGSRSHWVAVGQSEQDVREYGVFNQDLFDMADWLKEKGIKTVAMKSTGTYWQSLYAVLISKGFDVILCNGKFTKNIKGKKTDIKDCQCLPAAGRDPETPHTRPVDRKLFTGRKNRRVADILPPPVQSPPFGGLCLQKDAEIPSPAQSQAGCGGTGHLWTHRTADHPFRLRRRNRPAKAGIPAPRKLSKK